MGWEGLKFCRENDEEEEEDRDSVKALMGYKDQTYVFFERLELVVNLGRGGVIGAL